MDWTLRRSFEDEEVDKHIQDCGSERTKRQKVKGIIKMFKKNNASGEN